MSNVIGVKFKTGGRVYFFDPVELEIHTGDGVIVETARGEEFGDVVSGPVEVEEEKIVAPLKPVLRVATEEDWRLRRQFAAKESEAYATGKDSGAQAGYEACGCGIYLQRQQGGLLLHR